MGNREENLTAALDILERNSILKKKSSIYETDPWGYEEQPAFLNQVVEIEVNLEPLDLLMFLKSIEALLGRKPTFRNGPRTIDLDILFYDDRIIVEDQIVIPHLFIEERAFVLVPMAEIAPGYKHPILGLTIAELLKQVDSSSVHLYNPRL
ncbi:MAG TPA: 2-amino-4-hydroxy-6-hydroxymethyldihydropteridine diphosphokinase [Anaerolineae bacterium]|nr:2-amino-4-hydroxy-6-hydroxymethyldihydropteridine diphosphokinase [Anaerolineae bacterium]